jgi:hypothetical protein
VGGIIQESWAPLSRYTRATSSESAVVQCGGFLKGDIHHYPLPWNSLKYNVARNAYETDLTLEELRSGRSELDGEEFDWGDRSPVYQDRHYWTV